MHKIFIIGLLLLQSMYSFGQQKFPFIPIADFSNEFSHHVVIAEGTEDIYQGHPTTVLMDDGRTIFAVWSFDHGGKSGPMAKSTDGGITWESVETPADWETMVNCPSIYRLTDPSGIERLMVFAGSPNMAQTWSEDGGKTWTAVRSLDKPCVMAFSSIIRLQNGDYLGLYHRGHNDEDKSPLTIWQSVSEDGGVTWGESRMVSAVEGHSPCEPEVFRSPNGRQLVCLLRENQRKGHSLFIVSNDEGQTWSEPKETPWGLSGDRHKMQYAPDGRIVSVFRDQAPNSPTKGHFVAWVGTYHDLMNGLSGQYKVKLLHSYAGWDCGYPGLEILPDGTFIATTYLKYRPGNKKHSVVSLNFKIQDLDKLFQ